MSSARDRHPAHGFALACAMIVSAVTARSVVVLGAIGALGVTIIAVQRVPVRRVVVRLRGMVLVVGGAIAVGAFVAPEHALRNGATLASRVLDSALWGTWLVATYSAQQIDDALRALGAPRAIVTLLALTRRFGGQLRSTMHSAWNATALRGGFRTPSCTASSVGMIAGLLVVRALDRTERARLALDLRGGDGALFAAERRLAWSSWLALVAVVGAWAVAGRTWGTP